MIETHGLSKRFDGTMAVEELTLSVARGEVFGFLGPNGAGKTTTVRMLTGLIAPTWGEAQVNGFAIGREDDSVRATVGVLTESPGLYERLSAEVNLSIYSRLYGVDDVSGQVKKYLSILGLWDRRREAVSRFSKGMKQKLAIARALIHEPQTLFLDEPTGGLDPEAAHTVRTFLEELRTEGRTIFLTTHNLDEAERLCDRIGVINTRLLRLGDPEELRSGLYGRRVRVRAANLGAEHVKAAQSLPFVSQAKLQDGALVVTLENPQADNPALVQRLIAAGAQIQFVEEADASLEDVYLSLVRDNTNTKHRQR